MDKSLTFPIPINAIPIARNQRQEQILGDREVTLDIGWTKDDDMGRVVVTISKRDDKNAEQLRELFYLSKDRAHWLFRDLNSDCDPTQAKEEKVKRYLLEKYNLDIDWNGHFWDGELPY